MTPNNNDDQFDDGLDQFDETQNDEFGADDFTAEGGAEDGFAEEDWDSYDDKETDGGADDQELTPAKKKSGNFNKIVIGIAVLVGAGIFVLQFGGGNNSPAPTENPTMAAVETPVPAASVPAPISAAPAAQDDPAQAPQGGFLQEGGIAALEQDIATSYKNSELVEESAAPAEVDNAVTPPMPTAITSDVAAASPVSNNISAGNPVQTDADAPIRMPKAEEVLLKQPAAQSPDPALSAANDGLPVSPASPTVVDTTVKADVSAEMIAKMDQILARLGQLESDVALLKNGNETDVSAELSSLQNSLKALEQKVETAPIRQKAEKASEADPAGTMPKPQILGSTTVSDSVSTATAPKVVKKAPVQWVLKGAQPGRAMVSQPGESDMRSVAIGDSLPGIGKITAISYENGRWQVIGTQGTIHQ